MFQTDLPDDDDGGVITDRASFERYPWPDPFAGDYSHFERLAPELPGGMKLLVMGPGGVLENVIGLVGFDRLCIMTMEDETLAADLFDAVGSRLISYYGICGAFSTVGACISNDDWGFKTQTMLSPDAMRRYVFPWHKRIVDTIHAAGKPAILHSCGNLSTVMDDIVDRIGYDAKHSYEDAIMPVEQAYDRLAGRIAVLGGIDVDFICRSTPDQVYRRSLDMLERSADRGGYALGSGNSIPEFVPRDNYFAMLRAVTETR